MIERARTAFRGLVGRPRVLIGLSAPLIGVSLLAPWAKWTSCQCEGAGRTTYLNVFRSFRQFETYLNPHVLHLNPAPIALAMVALQTSGAAVVAFVLPGLRPRRVFLALAGILECLALVVMIGAPYLDHQPADEASKNLIGSFS